jgi:hypothetical protein
MPTVAVTVRVGRGWGPRRWTGLRGLVHAVLSSSSSDGPRYVRDTSAVPGAGAGTGAAGGDGAGAGAGVSVGVVVITRAGPLGRVPERS